MKRCPPLGDPQQLRALQDALYVLGGKWKLPIIQSICNGNHRFRDIERSIPGITTRMLSKELKELEMNGIISRTVYADIPVSVLYEPTEYSKVYGPIIMTMIEFGFVHQQKMRQP
ncbi:helix-turn-helix domain-containing protein [Hymenobacter sp. GOD-10R]|uniref:winged helix-turn-helix transcriptional regulator n=1 Tax=Hymenobacter sp. GOD-10R TaxID=3093922 RepID=UPI002D79B638|nr:helix-turn-helix domain-containing protein [Hymenobacter sp. GOD-10R]WRQ26147.1 helix-turn-helix domain-containing protein [Hymenobacter sp. GOD-10R]